jgi:hypothetical protein
VFGTVFVAVPSVSSAPALRSVNGVAFEKIDSGVFGRSIAYGNGAYVVVGETSSFTSIDGVSWSPVELGLSNPSQLRFSNGYFIVLGLDRFNKPDIVQSTNGRDWTSQSRVREHLSSKSFGKVKSIVALESGSESIAALEVDPGLLIVSQQGDSSEWRASLSLPSATTARLAYVGSVWILSAQTRAGSWVNLRSRNCGLDWEDLTSSVGGGQGTVVAVNNHMFVMGPSGLLIHSADGVDWWHVRDSIASSARGLFYSEKLSKYVLASKDGLFLSPSGSRQSWKSVSGRAPQGMTYVKLNDGREIFGGFDQQGAFVVSSDLVSWSQVGKALPRAPTSPTPTSVHGIESSKIHRVAISQSGFVACVVSGFQEDGHGSFFVS